MNQNPTLIVVLSVLLNGDDVSAKKLLIWRRIDMMELEELTFFKIIVVIFFSSNLID